MGSPRTFRVGREKTSLKRCLLALVLGHSLSCLPAPKGWLVELHGVVTDSKGDGLSGANVGLLNSGIQAEIGDVFTDENGRWRLPIFVSEDELDQVWSLEIEAGAMGFLDATCHWQVAWRDATWPAAPHSLGPGQQVDMGALRTPRVVLFEDTGPMSIQTTVQSATNGGGIGEVRVELRAGWNAPLTEPVVTEARSGSQGLIDFDLPAPGVYTAYAESTGGHEATLAPLWVGPGSPEQQRILMSPLLVGDAIRAALIWRDARSDLDLHMSGPLAGEAGRYQVYVSDTPHPIYGEAIAEMEWVGDNWETVGVYTVRDGTYRFSAHDRENGWASDSLSLSMEEPTLLLWTEEGPLMETLAPGALGTVWNALEYDSATGVAYRIQGMREGVNEWDVSAF